MPTFSSNNPLQFLEEIYEIDPMAAVRIANKWGDPEATQAQYEAAWTIVQKQQVLPLCVDCKWPVVSDDPHLVCEDYLHGNDCVYVDDFDDEDEDYVSSSEVYHRAYAHFGNDEMAREAASMYPGDFI